jgi:hypothetical protein
MPNVPKCTYVSTYTISEQFPIFKKIVGKRGKLWVKVGDKTPKSQKGQNYSVCYSKFISKIDL